MACARVADEVELMQVGVKTHSQESDDESQPSKPSNFLEMMLHLKTPKVFNCSDYPSFCRAPFWCQSADLTNPVFAMKPITREGHSYIGSFCIFPESFAYIKTCVRDRRLKKAATVHWRDDEQDASMCFMEGHCTNEAVRDNTSVAEAEVFCDNRFGHDGWVNWTPGLDRALMGMMGPFSQLHKNSKTGIQDRKISRFLTKLSCAMGNFHCDVMACKETYCQDPYYVKKYKHLEPGVAGHLVSQVAEPL